MIRKSKKKYIIIVGTDGYINNEIILLNNRDDCESVCYIGSEMDYFEFDDYNMFSFERKKHKIKEKDLYDKVEIDYMQKK